MKPIIGDIGTAGGYRVSIRKMYGEELVLPRTAKKIMILSDTDFHKAQAEVARLSSAQDEECPALQNIFLQRRDR